MTAYFERFRKLKDRHGEDPKFKGAAAAIRQARISSSVVLGVMTIVMGTLLADIFSGPFAHLDVEQLSGNRNMAMKDVAPPPAADGVKIVSAQPKLDAPCEQQTWPYIDRRCLTESTKAPIRTANKTAGRTPWRDEGKKQKPNTGPFDPRTAAADVTPRPQEAVTTDGVASPEDKAAQPPATDLGQAAAPAASADAASNAQPSSPLATGSASVQGATMVPLPVARPAIASATPATADDQPSAAAVAGDQQEAREEKPRRRASRQQRDKGERVVRRWRELIYDLPDGRVLTFPRGF